MQTNLEINQPFFDHYQKNCHKNFLKTLEEIASAMENAHQGEWKGKKIIYLKFDFTDEGKIIADRTEKFGNALWRTAKTFGTWSNRCNIDNLKHLFSITFFSLDYKRFSSDEFEKVSLCYEKITKNISSFSNYYESLKKDDHLLKIDEAFDYLKSIVEKMEKTKNFKITQFYAYIKDVANDLKRSMETYYLCFSKNTLSYNSLAERLCVEFKSQGEIDLFFTTIPTNLNPLERSFLAIMDPYISLFPELNDRTFLLSYVFLRFIFHVKQNLVIHTLINLTENKNTPLGLSSEIENFETLLEQHEKAGIQ